MTHETLILSTLDSLFVLHGMNAAVDASAIARRVGTSPTRVAEALLHLEGKGLVDATKARLTLAGLSAAAAFAAHREMKAHAA